MAEAVLGPLTIPIAVIAAIVIGIIAWKVFKFAAKKILAVLQGLVGLALLGLVFFSTGSLETVYMVGLLLAGIGIVLSAVSNFLG